MRIQQQAGFVLHTRPFRETSLLVEVFTREHGRLAMLAKGARRIKSNIRGILLPFQPLLLSWSGKGELPVATSAELFGRFLRLQGHGRLCGFYLNELVVRLLHRYDAHQSLFDHYQRVIYKLEQPADHEWMLRLFEKHMLKELGYALVLDQEADTGERVRPESSYHYEPQQGVLRTEPDSSDNTIVKGATLIALAEEKLTDDYCRQEVKRLMRSVIGYHLGGRVLHSRKLFHRPYKGE